MRFTVKINGRVYGIYCTLAEAEEIASKIHVNAIDDVTVE